jgi:hypothetical protein
VNFDSIGRWSMVHVGLAADSVENRSSSNSIPSECTNFFSDILIPMAVAGWFSPPNVALTCLCQPLPNSKISHNDL